MTRSLPWLGRAAVLAVLLTATGCGRLVTDHVVTGPERSPTSGRVQIVMQNEPVPPGFQEVGIVRAIGMGNKANLQSVMQGLGIEANRIGANAVVNIRLDQGMNGVAAVGTAGIIP